MVPDEHDRRWYDAVRDMAQGGGDVFTCRVASDPLMITRSVALYDAHVSILAHRNAPSVPHVVLVLQNLCESQIMRVRMPNERHRSSFLTFSAVKTHAELLRDHAESQGRRPMDMMRFGHSILEPHRAELFVPDQSLLPLRMDMLAMDDVSAALANCYDQPDPANGMLHASLPVFHKHALPRATRGDIPDMALTGMAIVLPRAALVAHCTGKARGEAPHSIWGDIVRALA